MVLEWNADARDVDAPSLSDGARAGVSFLKPGRLLIVDDNEIFANCLATAMEKRGFTPRLAFSFGDGLGAAAAFKPQFAIIDNRLGGNHETGLELIQRLHDSHGDTRFLLLTGHADISTAVAAIRIGAWDCLVKPACADEIETALLHDDDATLPPPEDTPVSPDQVRLTYIQEAYRQHHCNILQTARYLNMHRRTLQRTLSKYPIQ